MEIIEVILNGQKLCRAGIQSKQSSFGVIVNLAVGEGRPSLINLDVSGLDIENAEHVHWVNTSLEPNDEVTIKIIQSALSDEPSKKSSVEAAEQKYLESKVLQTSGRIKRSH